MNMIAITLTESPEGPDRLNRAYSVDNTEKHEKLSEGPVNDCTFVLTVNRCRSRMIGSRLERYDTMVSKNTNG